MLRICRAALGAALCLQYLLASVKINCSTSKKLTVMKQVENSFIITGFVAKDAEIRTFTNNDVARFPMAIGRKETKDNATNRVSAFINVESLAQERQRIVRVAEKRYAAHHRGVFEARRVDRQERCQAERHQVRGQEVLRGGGETGEGRKAPTQGSRQETEGGGIDRFPLRKERLRPLFSCSMHMKPCSF